MKQLKRIIIWSLIFCFLSSYGSPAYAYTLIPEYLCEMGLELYRQGYVNDALQEFNKALIANPDYEPAHKYIQMIQKKGATAVQALPAPAVAVPAPLPAAVPVTVPAQVIKPLVTPAAESAVIRPPVKLEPAKTLAPSREAKEKAMEKAMSGLEIVTPRAVPTMAAPQAAPVFAQKRKEIPAERETPPFEKAAARETKELPLPKTLVLDESVKALTSALEIEQNNSVVISGHNIQRFLLTEPDVLSVERKSGDELLVTARNFGYTYLHVWDDNGRWTLEFLTVPVRPKGPTYEDILRRSEERVNTFKIRYSMDWNSFYTNLNGTTIKNAKRRSYSFGHFLYLNGTTPYGDIDSSASVRTLATSTDLTYFTLGLTKGKIGPFDDFTLRAVDFSPSITNLEFTSPTLRGLMLASPAFSKKLDYTLFWGREGGGRFGDLSPGLTKSKNSFLTGINTSYLFSKNRRYGLSVFHGWGRDRPVKLNRYGYDSYADWGLGKWDVRYEVGYDSQNLAHLLTTRYEIPKLKFTEEVRNIDKDFVTMTGTGWRVGELGSLSTLSYTPTENLDINSRFDMFRDRLFPNPNKPSRWNNEFRTDLNWRLDSLTSLRSDYSFSNDVGRISPFRSLNTGLGLYKTFDWKRRVSTYVNYRHQEDRYSASPQLDYSNEKITMGVRFGLARELYYFLNREFNWLSERFTGNHSRPEVFETGLDWSSQLLKSLFYSSFRLTFHEEKHTLSPLSFLSGESYVEAYGTLSYRPAPEQEWYLSSRIRKIRPEKPGLNKRMEADLNAGLRYLWDTGVRWEPIGTIEGYVFKDLNSDGIREEGEQPLEGVRLWLAKRSTTTDASGYYKFDKVRARKAYVNLDTQTLPAGFVLTVPVTQEVAIANHRSATLDFGVISRSEIWGVVFLDVNGDGAFNIGDGDKGIKGVALILENGLKAMTDGSGQYRFPNVSVGEHTVTLDLNTLPVEYLPTVPLKKTVNIFEGVSYNYSIPVRQSSK